MATKLSVEDSAKLFKMLDTQHEDWIIARALQILERRVLRLGKAMCDSEMVKDFLRLKLADERNEIFAMLFLDSQYRLIAYEELFHGSLSQTTVYPRVVVGRALEHNAAGVILVHNHPSGVSDPSRADQSLTSILKSALEHVEVRVVDHLIIGEGQPFSFVEQGLL